MDEEKAPNPLSLFDQTKPPPVEPVGPPSHERESLGPMASAIAVTLVGYAATLQLEWAVVSFVYDNRDEKRKKCIYNFSQAATVFGFHRHDVAEMFKEWTLYRDFPKEKPGTRLPRKLRIDTDDIVLPNEERAEALDLIRGYVQRARVSIFLMIYIFTLDTLSEDLRVAVQDRNVEVWVYLDDAEARKRNAKHKTIKLLLEAGVKVRVSKGCAIMHRKHGIFDFETVMFGTACWSNNAFHHNQEDIAFGHGEAYARLYLQIMWRNWRFHSKSPMSDPGTADQSWCNTPHQWRTFKPLGKSQKSASPAKPTILVTLNKVERRRRREKEKRDRKAKEAVEMELSVKNIRAEVALLTAQRDSLCLDRAQQMLDALVIQWWRIATCFGDASYRVLSVVTTGEQFEAALDIGLIVTRNTLDRVFPRLTMNGQPTELGQRLLGQRLNVQGSTRTSWGDVDGIREVEVRLQFEFALLAVLHSVDEVQTVLHDALIDDNGAVLGVE